MSFWSNFSTDISFNIFSISFIYYIIMWTWWEDERTLVSMCSPYPQVSIQFIFHSFLPFILQWFTSAQKLINMESAIWIATRTYVKFGNNTLNWDFQELFIFPLRVSSTVNILDGKQISKGHNFVKMSILIINQTPHRFCYSRPCLEVNLGGAHPVFRGHNLQISLPAGMGGGACKAFSELAQSPEFQIRVHAHFTTCKIRFIQPHTNLLSINTCPYQ